jgi:hypothetical protein
MRALRPRRSIRFVRGCVSACVFFATRTQVGLPNDELYRRVGVFRGVYATSDPIADGECSFYVIVEAQSFNAQLPLTPVETKDGRRVEGVRVRMFAGSEYHLLGYTDAFSNLRALQTHANRCLRDKKGFYYVLQVDGLKLTNVEDITVDEETEDEEPASAQAVVDEDRLGTTTTSNNQHQGSGSRLRVHGLINVEAIDKIWIALREGEGSYTGKFLDCTSPAQIDSQTSSGIARE